MKDGRSAPLRSRAALLAALVSGLVACGGSSAPPQPPPPDLVAPASEADPAGGTFRVGPSVTLRCTDVGGSGCGKIHFTTDGSAPSSSSPFFSAPIPIPATATLRFRAVDRAGNVEEIRTEHYLVDGVAPITTATPPGGTFTAAQEVSLACDDGAGGSGCAAVRYTLDGTEPSLASPVYAVTIVVGATATVRFSATDAAGNVEAPRSAAFVIDLDPPVTTPSPAAGDYGSAQAVTLACADAGSGCAATYYTVDGSDPTPASSLYAGAIPLPPNERVLLRFSSLDHVGRAEPARSAEYLVDTLAPASSASVPASAYGAAQDVALSCQDAGAGCAAIHYTLDGEDPTLLSPQYGGTLTVAASATLKFFAVDAVGNAESPRSVVYVIDTVLPVSTATPPPQFSRTAFTVSLSCSDGGGVGCDRIYYTLNPTLEPTLASSVYTAPFVVADNRRRTIKWFATDLVGNREPVQTGVWGADSIGPTTSGWGGYFAGPTPVELTCTDQISGCASTHYASSLGGGWVEYTGTITLSAVDQTLTYYSVDRVGNVGAESSATFTFFTTPPAVVSTWPAAGATKAPPATELRVTFDHLIAGPGTITVSDGVTQLPGNVQLVGGADARLVLSAPLAWGKTYTVTIAGFADPAGNVQAQPYTFGFSTAATLEQVSGAGSADLANDALAYDDAGRGVAAWVVRTGTGCRIEASIYDPTQDAWSAPEVLAAVATETCDFRWRAHAVSNGAEIFLAWQYVSVWGSDAARGKVLGGTGWGSETQFHGRLSNSRPIAAAGARFAAVSENNGSVYAWVRDGGFWSGSQILNSGVSDGGASFPSVAGGPGGAFLVGWQGTFMSPAGTRMNAWTCRWTPAGGWGSARLLENLTGAPAVAGNADRFLVAFAGQATTASPSRMRTALGDGETFVQDDRGPSGFMVTPLVAESGSSLAVTWETSVAVHDGAVWGASTTALAETHAVVAIAGSGSGFVVAGQLPAEVVLRAHGAAGPGPLASVPAVAGTSTVRVARRGAGSAVSFTDASAAGHLVRAAPFDGTAAGAKADVLAVPPASSAAGVRIVRGAGGDVLAAWRQRDRGAWALFAAVRAAGSWSDPVRLAADLVSPDLGLPVALAASGDELLAAYQTRTGSIAVRTFSAGAWSGETVLSGGSSCGQLSVTGGAPGLAAAFVCGPSPNAQLRAAIRPAVRPEGSTSWAPVVIAPDATGPALATNGSTFRLAFVQPVSRTAYWSEATRPGLDFAWSAPVIVNGTMPPAALAPRLAAVGSTYLLAASASGGATHVASSDGALAANVLSTSCQRLELASDGATALLAGLCGGELVARRRVGGSWEPQTAVYSAAGTAAPQAFRLSAGSAGYGILLSNQTSSSRPTPPLVLGTDLGDAWSTPRAIPDLPSPFRATDSDYDVAGTSGAAVVQADPAEVTLDRVWFREGF